jgi:ABC-2 type transport system permease protein
MARVFVRLKGRLLLNSLAGKGWRIVGVIFGAIYGVLFAVIGFGLLASARTQPRNGEVIAILFGAAIAIGWTLLPLLGFGSDETLDPVRLALLPLTRRQLVTGLLAASLFGVGPVATALVLLGGIAGFAPAGPGAVLVVLAVVLQLALCVSLSRAVVTALSAALRSRRGRDLRVILVALVALAPQLLRFAFLPDTGRDTSLNAFRSTAHALEWVPFVFPMRAMVAAGKGHLFAATLELLISVVVIGLLLWWWSRSIDHVVTTAEAQGPSTAKPVEASDRDPLFGAVLAWLPRTRMGAVAARESRVAWRDPRRRVQLISGILLPFIILAGFISRGAVHRPGLVYAALLIVALGGRANNQLGMDGRAWWIHEASGTDLRSDLRGKNVSLLVTTLPIVVVAAVVLAGLGGGWTQLIPVVLLAVATCGVQLAIGNVLSLLAPWPLPQSTSNMWGSGSGQGCLVALLGLLGMAVLGVICIPGVIALLLIHGVAGRTLVACVALPYGYAMWRIGTYWAERYGARRGPELLQILERGSNH